MDEKADTGNAIEVFKIQSTRIFISMILVCLLFTSSILFYSQESKRWSIIFLDLRS